MREYILIYALENLCKNIFAVPCQDISTSIAFAIDCYATNIAIDCCAANIAIDCSAANIAIDCCAANMNLAH